MKEKILEMVRLVNPDVPENPNVKLIDEGYIDSFGVYMILAQIELDYGITVDENEMEYNNFKDINSIVDYVSRKMENND